MAESKSKDEWQHTSAKLTLLANIHRDPKKQRAYRPSDFSPHKEKQTDVIKGESIRIMKDVFIRPEKETQK